MSEPHEKPHKKPVDYDELFPGRFLKAGLLQGRAITLTIADVDTDSLPQDDGKMKTKGIILFNGTDKGLALNSTNGQCLKAMFGRKVQEWIGKRVTLKPDKDRDPKNGRGLVDCIRIAGSPDIAETMQIMIELPRRKPKPWTLEKTPSNGAARQHAEPPSDMNGDA